MNITISGQTFEFTDSMIDRFHTLYVKTPTCWLGKPDASTNGYARYSFRIDSKNYFRKMHQISYALHHGPIPKGMVVRHKCNVRSCCNPDHLILGTVKQNAGDVLEANQEFLQTCRAKIAEIRALIAVGQSDDEIVMSLR